MTVVEVGFRRATVRRVEVVDADEWDWRREDRVEVEEMVVRLVLSPVVDEARNDIFVYLIPCQGRRRHLTSCTWYDQGKYLLGTVARTL